MPEIISWMSARAWGMKRYFTGEPCRRGHICERWSRDRSCYECSRAKCRAVIARRRLRDPEWARRVNLENYAKHREKRMAQMREASKDSVAAAAALRDLGVFEDKRRRASPDRERENEQQRRSRLKRMAEDPSVRERQNALARDYYRKNRERCQEKNRERSKLRTVARRALREMGIEI